ncbi:MAG: PLDc N-terminal domain-containing protein [Deltaproteobacteria bacterium]|nr:PLDc N-terminal domain-containing protein [Deltaproteobacteria bacterium]
MDTTTITIIGMGILFFMLTCWAILDVARKNFGTIGKKALWGFIAFIPFIGFIIYFIFGYKKGIKPQNPTPTTL